MADVSLTIPMTFPLFYATFRGYSTAWSVILYVRLILT